MRPAWKILYWVGVAVTSCAFAELTVRVWDFKPTYVLQAKGTDAALPFYLDSRFLFRLVPSKQEVNSSGYRDGRFLPKQEKRRVVVIGDSFPMGLAVRRDETFPKTLETFRPDLEVLNLGIQGYGPDQELRVLEDDGIALDPNFIVWSLYPSNDFNDLAKNRLFIAKAGSGEIEARHPNAVEELLPLFRAPMMIRFLTTQRFFDIETEASLQPLLFLDSSPEAPLNEEILDLMRGVVRTFKKIADDKGVKSLVVIIPSFATASARPDSTELDRLQRYDRAAESIIRGEGFDLLDLSNDFVAHPEYYSDKDIHLSVEGHREVARRIAEILNLRLPR